MYRLIQNNLHNYNDSRQIKKLIYINKREKKKETDIILYILLFLYVEGLIII